MKNEEYLLLAKRNLYGKLLKKDGGGTISGLTDNEIEIMYLLSIDEQIQKYLTEGVNALKEKAKKIKP